MNQDLDNLSEIPLAELKELEARFEEESDMMYQQYAHTSSPYKEKYYTHYLEKIAARDKIKEELVARNQLFADLSKLALTELKELEARYLLEGDYWHKEFIGTENSPAAQRYFDNYEETKRLKNKIREEIASRR